MSKHDHYFFDVSKYEKVDIYRLIEIIGITCPVAQHVFKKAAAAGQRGHKDLQTDWQNIMDSAARKLEMIEEDAGQSVAEDTDSLWQEGERRMDNIASSHGDGEHYESEWIEWNGDGSCPVDLDDMVEAEWTNGENLSGPGGGFRWWWVDDTANLVRYRLIHE